MKTEKDMEDNLLCSSEDPQRALTLMWFQPVFKFSLEYVIWGMLFQILPPLTERTDCPKVVCLQGTSQSPLTIDEVTLLAACFSWIKSINSGGTSPCTILYTAQAKKKVFEMVKILLILECDNGGTKQVFRQKSLTLFYIMFPVV